MKLGTNIKKFRTEAGLTQEELAARLSISPQAVSKWERGESLPDTAILPEISDVLGVSLDRLFGHRSAGTDDILGAVYTYLNSVSENERLALAFKLNCYCENIAFGWSPDVLELSRFEPASPSGSISVCCESEHGFIYSSLRGELPFSMLCLEPKNGFDAVLKPDEKYREFFEILSDKNTLDTLFALYKKESRFSFDAEYARVEFQLDDPVPTLEKLEKLVLRSESYIINGIETKIWMFHRDCSMIALFSLLNERIFHNRRFALQSNDRRSPYLK